MPPMDLTLELWTSPVKPEETGCGFSEIPSIDCYKFNISECTINHSDSTSLEFVSESDIKWYLRISFILSNGKGSAMSTFIVHVSYITEGQNSTLMKHSLVENPSVCLFPLLQFTCWSDESLLTECAGWISSSTLLMEPDNFSFIVKTVTHFEVLHSSRAAVISWSLML